METLFDPAVYREILRRVELLQPDSQRQWGKMTAAQTLEHTARALEMAAGKKKSKQAFLGKIIGWTFRKGFVSPKPFPRNSPTGPDLVVQGEPDFRRTKERLKTLLGEFHALGEQGCDGNIHLFFGRMTGAEWGVTQFKHLDHHLRQFGV
jgi:hypothetical protein